MIKEAIKFIIDNSEAKEMKINGMTFTDKQMHPVKDHLPERLQVSTLTAVVDYIKANIDKMILPVLIQIEGPLEVNIKSALYGDFNQRNTFLSATPMIPHFSYDKFMDAENFNIAMQSKFIPTEESALILKVAGNVKEEAVRNVGDDGISQSATVRTGVTKVENVIVPNPVTLQPYRTFIEIDQPESKFVFRMQDGPRMALFEADGGAWKVEAMQKIKEYLQKELESEEVVILA